jgi:hypothetical protein
VDNIRMDLGEVGWSDMDWISLAQGRDRWRALVNAVMNLRMLLLSSSDCSIPGSLTIDLTLIVPQYTALLFLKAKFVPSSCRLLGPTVDNNTGEKHDQAGEK